MSIFRRAALTALVPLCLAGCAGTPRTQALQREVRPSLQPMEVQVGVKQPELYAAFNHSQAGASAAAACGAVPGLGILLAAACGGALGAVDAGVNASRAKDAETFVRPLKDELVEVRFDQLMSDALQQSLLTVPDLKLASVKVTKDVNDKSYMTSFRASEAGAVMYVNIDYHMSTDLSTLEVSARGLIYPRSADARRAAKLAPELAANEQTLPLKDAAYRMDVVYQARLPAQPGATPDTNRDGWKADSASLLRGSLQDGIQRVSRTLALDLGHDAASPLPSLRKVPAPIGGMADLLAEENGGQLQRFADGSLHYFTAAVASTAPAAPGAAATAPAPASVSP